LDREEKNCTIPVAGAYPVDEASWHGDFVTTSLVFTAVFGNNLDDLAKYLAAALRKRCVENREQVLTVITCENLTSAAHLLKESVLACLGPEEAAWLSAYVGFSEAIVLRTCLGATPEQSPLTVRAQNFFELPCDGDGLKELLHVPGLKPMTDFGNQLRRKIYTYNCINAVITYLGAQKGYAQLYEAGNDPEILQTARQAANETSGALVAEFGFDPQEQAEWTTAAFAKFADRNIPDPIERNGADPVRKLSREDRLIGPASLALKHHIHPEGLLKGILACFAYRDPATRVSVADVIREKGPHFVLAEICGLSGEEPLFGLLSEEILKKSPHGI
jgi:mannitol-1-phosphate 5-dehydrogenase